MNNKSQRAWIYAIVGVYLLYTAWQLFQGLGDPETPQIVMAVFTVFFAAVGVMLLVFSIRSMRKNGAQEENEQEENEQEEAPLKENGEANEDSFADAGGRTDSRTGDTPDSTERHDEFV